MKRKYKVELTQNETFVVDILAEDEQEATDLALIEFADAEQNGMTHYFGTGDGGLNVVAVYDVTETDDPFNPSNV